MDEITSKFKSAFERMAELESLQLSMEEDANEGVKEKWFHERSENAKKTNFQEKEGACVLIDVAIRSSMYNSSTLPFAASQTLHAFCDKFRVKS